MSVSLFAQNNTMDFDGIDDHFVVTGISELEVDIDKLTLSAWVNFNVLNTPGGYGIITKSSYPNNTNCDYYVINSNNSACQMYTVPEGGNIYYNNNKITLFINVPTYYYI